MSAYKVQDHIKSQLYVRITVMITITHILELKTPKGGRGCIESPSLSGISGLSFDSTLLSLSSSSAYSRCCFSVVLFSAYWPFSCFSQNSSTFFVNRWAFWFGSCLAARR